MLFARVALAVDRGGVQRFVEPGTHKTPGRATVLCRRNVRRRGGCAGFRFDLGARRQAGGVAAQCWRFHATGTLVAPPQHRSWDGYGTPPSAAWPGGEHNKTRTSAAPTGESLDKTNKLGLFGPDKRNAFDREMLVLDLERLAWAARRNGGGFVLVRTQTEVRAANFATRETAFLRCEKRLANALWNTLGTPRRETGRVTAPVTVDVTLWRDAEKVVGSARIRFAHERGGLDAKGLGQLADGGTTGGAAGLEPNDGGPRDVRRGGQVRLSQHLSDPQPLELRCRVKSLRARHARGQRTRRVPQLSRLRTVDGCHVSIVGSLVSY